MLAVHTAGVGKNIHLNLPASGFICLHGKTSALWETHSGSPSGRQRSREGGGGRDGEGQHFLRLAAGDGLQGTGMGVRNLLVGNSATFSRTPGT